MKRQNRYTNDNYGTLPGNKSLENPDYEILATAQDSVLFETISKYMTGRLYLEDVKNDPDLQKIEEEVKKLISDYTNNISGNKDNEKFIRDIFEERAAEEKLIDEINQIKHETGKSDVDMATAEWVKEWNKMKQSSGARDPKTEEIRDFITSSLEPEKSEKEIIQNTKEARGFMRSPLVRYISLPVAAVLGVFMLLRTLLPSSDPEKLFKSFYEPFNVVSSVTRNVSLKETEGYSTSVEQYKLGEYQTAASGFSNAILTDTSVISPRFFMGLTLIGLGNYDQAINLLKGIADRSGEYGKEARWYLGLIYLKTGDKEKAAECFEFLAKSSGFYSGRSEKILRRLK